jgi:hypothetical protein
VQQVVVVREGEVDYLTDLRRAFILSTSLHSLSVLVTGFMYKHV